MSGSPNIWFLLILFKFDIIGGLWQSSYHDKSFKYADSSYPTLSFELSFFLGHDDF